MGSNNLVESDVDAAFWYKKAARQGEERAQNNLAMLYLHGRGVEKNEEEALNLLRLAAGNGNAVAQNSLGNLYLHGKYVKADLEESRNWFGKATEQYKKMAVHASIHRGEYSEYETVLCSPDAYHAARNEEASFDSFVSFEAIESFLRGQVNDDSRSLYRADFIANAAVRRLTTWSRIDDAVTNAFWDAAYELASREFPILELKPMQLTKGSTWITIRPQDMPTRPRLTYISFKGDKGHIDLTFSNTSLMEFLPKVSSLLEEGMTVHQTGKSSAIRINVGRFKSEDPSDNSLSNVREGFSASARLIAFYRQHRSILDNAATISVTTLR